MKLTNSRQRWYLASALIATVTLSTSQAIAQNVTGQINLISTIGGNPSLSPLVTWKVFRINPRDKNSIPPPPLYILNRHSISLNLSPGHYKVVVSLADVVKEQDFKIQAEDKHTLEVSVDGAKLSSTR